MKLLVFITIVSVVAARPGYEDGMDVDDARGFEMADSNSGNGFNNGQPIEFGQQQADGFSGNSFMSSTYNQPQPMPLVVDASAAAAAEASSSPVDAEVSKVADAVSTSSDDKAPAASASASSDDKPVVSISSDDKAAASTSSDAAAKTLDTPSGTSAAAASASSNADLLQNTIDVDSSLAQKRSTANTDQDPGLEIAKREAKKYRTLKLDFGSGGGTGKSQKTRRRFPSTFCDLERDNGIICPGIRRGSYIDQFYFDPITNRCYHYVYNGCGGNANRFSSLWECTQSCAQKVTKAVQ